MEWVPIDGFNGENINSRVREGILLNFFVNHLIYLKATCSWYTGPSLFEILNKCPTPKRNNDGPVRLPVLDTFKGFFFGKNYNLIR